MLGVLVFDTLPGLFIGITVSLLLLLYRSSRPHVARLARGAGGAWLDVERHPELVASPVVVVLRVEAGLYFANADHVRAAVRAAVSDRTAGLVIDAQTAPYIDVTATEMLAQVARDLEREPVQLGVAHPIGQTRDVLRRAADQRGTTITVYPTIDEAVVALSPS
jgi:sulfate permease, SulP family